MSTSTLWSKRQCGNFLALIFIVAAFCSCDVNDQVGKPLIDSSDELTEDEELHLSEPCHCCNWNVAAVKLVDAIPTDSFKISEPAAFEFFSLATRQDWFDSLDDNHQTFYRTIDQYGHYTTLIRPLLQERGIKVVDTLLDRTVLFFEDAKSEYIVDVEKYRHSDGVLMFTPGKAPVFWTANVLSLCCDDSSFVDCYFGK